MSDSSKKIKHLEFLQLAVTRMNVNCFLIKGWTITLVAALFALAAKDANKTYVMICYIPIPAFWLLDGFYMAVERRYRKLYNEIAMKDEIDIDFSMDAAKYAKGDSTWISGIFSLTLLVFYCTCIMTTIIVMYLIK